MAASHGAVRHSSGTYRLHALARLASIRNRACTHTCTHPPLSHDRTVRTCFRTGPDIPDMIPDTIPDTIGHSYRTQSDTLPDTIGHYRT